MDNDSHEANAHRNEDASNDRVPFVEDALNERVPPVEDANTDDDANEQATVKEDDPILLERSMRALDVEAADTIASEGESRRTNPSAFVTSDESDARVDEGDTTATADEVEARAAELRDWSRERSAHRVVVELKRIEAEVRERLEGVDPKRKRKLAGTRRWQELEEDLATWRFANRLPEESWGRLNQLIARRHHLFGRLRFLAGTRPTWNS